MLRLTQGTLVICKGTLIQPPRRRESIVKDGLLEEEAFLGIKTGLEKPLFF